MAGQMMMVVVKACLRILRMYGQDLLERYEV